MMRFNLPVLRSLLQRFSRRVMPFRITLFSRRVMPSRTPQFIAPALLALSLLLCAGWTYADDVFRITVIPDEAPTELARRAAPLTHYLEAKLGTKVEFIPVTDYAAAVEALVNRKVDLAWFGGFTFVQASLRSGGKIIPLVQREEDQNFHSVFITADPSIKTLADLKGKDFSFGSASSTSGHLMPRHFLIESGFDMEHGFHRISFSGAHDATVAAVAAGKVQAGALNGSVWDKFVAEHKVDLDKVHVFYTTPPFHDYNWSVHADLPAATRARLTDAFLSLDRSKPEGREILDLQRASRFVPAHAEDYRPIESAARAAGLL